MKKTKEKIAVIDDNGRVLKYINRVPHSHNGFDLYMFKGELTPGYWNGSIGTYIKNEVK